MNKIDIVYEDDDIVIVDKPAGILVHPTLAHEKDTLVDWLISKYSGIEKLNWPDKTRLGIIHRLDRETSGLIILAKTPDALEKFQELFRNRLIQKIYIALAVGDVNPKNGTINVPLARHPEKGIQMVKNYSYSFEKSDPKKSETDYQVIKNYRYYNTTLSLMVIELKTGRMHQIRASFKHIGYPILGDPLYSTKESEKISKELNIDRQFLHSSKLKFTHPFLNKEISVESKLPNDLQLIFGENKINSWSISK